MEKVRSLPFVAAGGAAGAGARYGALELVGEADRLLAIWAINLVGSLLLGVFVGLRLTRRGTERITRNQFDLLGFGFCGAFTTFSTFALDVARRLEDGELQTALLVGLATPLTAVLVAGFGYRMGSRP
ncbi:MAG: CrcB family protein [Actinomycetota bacterium]